jgi:RNA polymerase sigma-70 factor (ECF subfamily)
MAEIASGVFGLTGGSDPMSEVALIRRCREKDTEAFRWLVERYQSRIFSYARRMLNNREEAEDVTQETFVRAFNNVSRYDGRAAFSTWLFKIVANLCVDRARRIKRRTPPVSLEEDMQLSSPGDTRWDPEGRAVAADMLSALEKSVNDLSEKLRSVLLLHDLEGLDYQEIADTLGIPLGTVKSRLFLARGHLQAALTPYLDKEMQ